VFNNTQMRESFQDFLIDVESALNTFNVELREGGLQIAAQRKDFVGAREFFKSGLRSIIEQHTETLGRFRSYQRIRRLVGLQ